MILFLKGTLIRIFPGESRLSTATQRSCLSGYDICRAWGFHLMDQLWQWWQNLSKKTKTLHSRDGHKVSVFVASLCTIHEPKNLCLCGNLVWNLVQLPRYGCFGSHIMPKCVTLVTYLQPVPITQYKKVQIGNNFIMAWQMTFFQVFLLNAMWFKNSLSYICWI